MCGDSPIPLVTAVRDVSSEYSVEQDRQTRTQRTFQPTNAKILQALEQANAQQDMNRSLLRITYILQQCTCYTVLGVIIY